jgi:anti-sigma B factor antagonist
MPDRFAAGVLTLDIDVKGRMAIVRCQGRLVSGAQNILYSAVSRLIPLHQRIVLDLTDLARMDSMGVGTLVRLYVSSKSAGCALELVNLGAQIRHMLGTTNLLTVFTVVGEEQIKVG